MKAFGSEYAYDPKWGRLQRIYIRIFGIVDLPTRIRARAILKVLNSLPCERFLDFGAGTGVYSLFITRNPGCAGLAIDVDSGRVESIKHQAQQLGRTHLDVMRGSEDALQKSPVSAFSVILAIEVLMYLNNLDKVLRELRERLSPGGVLIAHVPIRDTHRPYENTLFTDAKLNRLFNETGFSTLQIHQTFGSISMMLSRIFSALMERPLMLALVYPWLLLVVNLTPRFVRNGSSRLIVARRPDGSNTDRALQTKHTSRGD